MPVFREGVDSDYTTVYRISPEGDVLLVNDIPDLVPDMQIQNVDGQIKFIGKNELNDLSIVVVELNDNLEPINMQPIEFDEDYDDSNVAFTSDGGFLVSFYDFTLDTPPMGNVKKLQADGQVHLESECFRV
jgi:hypothetical protein